MSRKTRRKIQRKKRNKSKTSKKRFILYRHFHCAPTNIWTKATTYFLILFEFVFIVWWLQETMLNWQEILLKLRNIVSVIGGG